MIFVKVEFADEDLAIFFVSHLKETATGTPNCSDRSSAVSTGTETIGVSNITQQALG